MPRWLTAWILCVCLLGLQQASLAHAYTHFGEPASAQADAAGQEGWGAALQHPCLRCLALCSLGSFVPAGLPPILGARPAAPVLAALPEGVVPAPTVNCRSRGPPYPLV